MADMNLLIKCIVCTWKKILLENEVALFFNMHFQICSVHADLKTYDTLSKKYSVFLHYKNVNYSSNSLGIIFMT